MKINEDARQAMIYDVDAYTSPDYARAERDRLWRRVWQEVGRVEEIPNIGDYITYDILDDSILIVRTDADKITAYHNVCQHRGRRLVDTPPGARHARGNTKHFVCGFHGWRWNIQGESAGILNKPDWGSCLTAENTRLAEVKVDTWGGWIFINMDPNSESLQDFLAPIPELVAPFELEKMRFRWRRWMVFDCNWKVAYEAFLEGYHLAQTHPEFLPYANWYNISKPVGRHATAGYGMPNERNETLESLMRVGQGDPRRMTAELQALTWDGTNAGTTQTLYEAAQRLVDELPEGTPADKVMEHWYASAKRDDAKLGVIWPDITAEQIQKCGTGWNMFPNFKINPLPTTTLCYNYRPFGYDPDKCIFEVFVIERFAEGEAPKTEWIYTPPEDEAWRTVLPQDFSNMAAVQQGMKSLGFKGPRPNPVQESSVANLHRALAEYMNMPAPRPLK